MSKLTHWATDSRIPLIAIPALILLANAPMLYGLVTTPPGTTFMGVIFNPPDYYFYLSIVRQGVEGHIAYTWPYTTESLPLLYTYPSYILLGHLSRWLSIPPPELYLLSRVLLGGILLLILYYFATFALNNLTRMEEWGILALIAFSSGSGWLIRLLSGLHALDIYAPISLFAILESAPHVILSEIVIIGIIAVIINGLRRNVIVCGIAAGSLLTMLAFLRPYYVVTLYATLCLLTVLAWLRWHEKRRQAALLASLAIGISFPAILYTVSLGTNPYMMQIAQANEPGWDLSSLLWGVGLLCPLALLGLWRCWSDHELCSRATVLVLAAWLGAAITLQALPLPFRVNYLQGIQIPLAMLTGVWLFRCAVPALRDWYSRLFNIRGTPVSPAQNGYDRVIAILSAGVVIALLFPSNAIWLLRPISASQYVWGRPSPTPFHASTAYLPNDELGALAWLRDHTYPSDLVVAWVTASGYIPALAGNGVWVERPSTTIEYERKEAVLRGFFGGETQPPSLGPLSGIAARYLYWGPDERRISTIDPAMLPGLEEAYVSNNVTIYRVTQDNGVRP